MHIDGGCHCGRVTYEAQIDPAEISLCHCTDCQELTGTGYRVSAIISKADFRLTGGGAHPIRQNRGQWAQALSVFLPHLRFANLHLRRRRRYGDLRGPCRDYTPAPTPRANIADLVFLRIAVD